MNSQFADLKTTCNYCRTDVDPSLFKSEWFEAKHYKTQECQSCSHEVRLKVEFEGSGHDTWSGKEPFKPKKDEGIVRTLEEKIQLIAVSK